MFNSVSLCYVNHFKWFVPLHQFSAYIKIL